ncbi:MAG: DUF2493 domain-containing protein [Defluviicoccus sp.]|nr:DUF2493 domain-containing protein [Defluviicoccus sp.]MDE0277856.1 DUF2493 domain-containing protein [Defluviicoccus sp.]
MTGYGSHTSQTRALTSAAIDARDFLRARKDRQNRAHLPAGTLVAIAGGKGVSDTGIVWATLDDARAKYADMVLVHGGGPGTEKIAASWAAARGVHQIVCRPNWDAHGRAAPFRRNDDLLNLLPKGIIAFPGTGVTANLVDKARQLGIPVHKVAFVSRADPPSPPRPARVRGGGALRRESGVPAASRRDEAPDRRPARAWRSPTATRRRRTATRRSPSMPR